MTEDVTGPEAPTRPLTIWGRASSCNVQKILWTLEELALPYVRIEAGGDAGGLDSPDYRALNPHSRIPTLRDQSVVVWESDAIVRYLCAAYGAGTLWPQDPAARAEADQWMTWATTEATPDWLALFWRRVRTPPAQQDPKAIARHHRATCERFQRLDLRLADREFVAGAVLGMADLSAGAMMYRWFEMPIERPAMPHLEAWYARLCERPAYREAICRPFDDLIGKLSF